MIHEHRDIGLDLGLKYWFLHDKKLFLNIL